MSDLVASDVAVVFGPIESWPGRLREPRERTNAQFKVPWSTTYTELRNELARIGVEDCSILVDLPADKIRLDGQIRSGARPGHPGVLVVFEHPEAGRLQFAADLYRDRWGGKEGWRDNVRAVVKTLEALRAVDRHGATQGAAQFRGYAALPAPIAMDGPSHMTLQAAIDLLVDTSTTAVALQDAWWRNADTRTHVIRSARAAAHPDRHDGDTELWDQVEAAVVVVDR